MLGSCRSTPALLTGLVFVYSDSVRQPLNSLKLQS